MGIDIRTEKVLSFREAAGYLPGRRGGKKPVVSTFYRWRQLGLETIRIGGQLCMSLEALQRFFDRLTGDVPNSLPTPEKRPVAGSAREARRQAQIERELEALGL